MDKDVDVVMAGEPKLLDPDVRDGLILKLAALVILDLPVARPSPRKPYAFAVGVIVTLSGGRLGAGAGNVPLFRAG